ncbi:MAG: GAF domain-containing protein, partial [Chloroflexota bacterium]|nr:GAF domain-containing protein [Chloroflexota bacterium]
MAGPSPDQPTRADSDVADAAPRDLARLAQQLGTARQLVDVFRALREYITRLTGSNALFVSLIEPDQRMRRCVYAWSDGEEVDVSRLPTLPIKGIGPHARAVASGQVVVVTDLQSQLAAAPNVPLGYDRDPRPANVSVAVPLAVLGRVVGGFEVQIIEHPDPGSCLPSLQVAANLAAAAIENVRLLETERQLRRAAEASEHRYRSSEQRLRLALEATGLGTWEYTPETGRLSWWRGAERLFGSLGAQLPSSWAELVALVSAEDRPGLQAMLTDVLGGGGTREVEFRLAEAGERPRWLACRVSRAGDGQSGGFSSVQGVVLDVTTRKEAEQQRAVLARSAQLRTLGQMASGIAHDLNQKLALISGFGELARDQLAASPDEVAEIQRLVQVSVRAAQDGAETLRKLLGFARAHDPE